MRDFIVGILSNWVADALGTAITGGAVLGWMRRRHPEWLPAICWGACGAVVILFGAAALRVIAIPLSEPRLVTSENVEKFVIAWMDNFHLRVQNHPIEGTLFSRIATMDDGNPINVSRYRSFDRYISLESILIPSPEDQLLLGRLTDKQASELFDEIRMEAARSKTNFNASRHPIKITLQKLIPITDSLTEDIFIGDIDDMDRSLIVLQGTVSMALRRSGVSR